MKSLILAAILGASMTHGLNSAEAHPRSGPHRHTTRVVVTKPVIVRPAPVRTVVNRAVVGQFLSRCRGHTSVWFTQVERTLFMTGPTMPG